MEASSREMCQIAEDMILQNHRVKTSVIAHEVGISAGIVSSALHSVLMKCQRSVPDGCHDC